MTKPKKRTTASLKKAHKAYLLRTCRADGTSRNEFQWPKEGLVTCPDWKPTPKCGNGLHGLLWGAGNGNLLSCEPDALWQVVGIDAWVEVTENGGGKVKTPSGEVVFTGERDWAVKLLLKLGADPSTCVYATLTGGDYSTLTGGDRSTLTGGDGSTLTGGHRSMLTGGDGSTLLGQWWDAEQGKWRRRLAEVGEDGILPNVPYRLDENGIWIQVHEEE